MSSYYPPSQLLSSKFNRMGEFSDIIDGYLRIENIDILKSHTTIDRINEFSVHCHCADIGNRWIKRDEKTGFSLVVSGMTYTLPSMGKPERLVSDDIALDSANKFIGAFDGDISYFTNGYGDPWKGGRRDDSTITGAWDEFGMVVVGQTKIGLVVFYDDSGCLE